MLGVVGCGRRRRDNDASAVRLCGRRAVFLVLQARRMEALFLVCFASCDRYGQHAPSYFLEQRRCVLYVLSLVCTPSRAGIGHLLRAIDGG
ncbi:hypothetical protein GY45DRAFT_964273 [Cubamyces sp. BRFM 1775]|nr:hypothetical protein GY45DRAFT_964273 [Cubamyces sp. BRFM 1775]